MREKLPGADTGWPRNFWLFASPVQSKNAEGESLGLPLLRSAFQHWTGMRRGIFELPLKASDFNKRLPLELIFGDLEAVPNEIGLYFNQI
jgi:hypothetical protein